MTSPRVDCTVAVTGVNATDNPAPGVGVARALRHEPAFGGRVIGLGYDALDPGFYAEGLFDGGAILPYPTAGRDAWLQRLREAARTFGFDVLIPTLDSELRLVAKLDADLGALGIRAFVPTVECIDRVSKPQLPRLGEDAGVPVAASETIVTPDAIGELIDRYDLPIVVKGVYYGAQVANSEADAVAAFHRFAASWGLPVIVQRFVEGDEYNVCALGDGEGNMVGAVAMRKLALTDKGKGWAGVTVENPALLALAERIIVASRWRGPMEVEIIAQRGSADLAIVEINPRFPAWVYLTAAAGQNLPFLSTLLALGLPVPAPIPRYSAGKMFVRISIDQIAELDTFAQLSARGFLLGRPRTST